MPDATLRIHAVLFDLGGTLIREPEPFDWATVARRLGLALGPDEITEAYVEVLTSRGVPPRPGSSEVALRFWQQALSRAARTDVPTTVATKFVAGCKAGAHPVRAFPDARPCLETLRKDHRRLGVISNSRNEALVRLLLGWVGLLEYFERIVSSGTEGIEKPDPEIFRRAVRRMGLEPPEALYVGNQAIIDAKAARSAGLHGLWIRRGGPEVPGEPPGIRSLTEVPLCIRRVERGLSAVPESPDPTRV